MKKKLLLILIISVLFNSPSFADTTGVINFLTYVVGAITFNVTGNLTTTIDANSGALGTGLNINYAMTTNTNISNLRLKALVLDSTGAKVNAFYPLGGTAQAQNFFLVLGNTDYPPTAAAISDCKQVSSTATLNANAIAYSGVVTITVTPISYNSSGYYNFRIRRNKVNNLNMSITTVPKNGTFNATSALDEPGDYKVEIYIDNIP